MPTLSALRRSKLPFFSHAAEDNHPGAGVPDEAKPFLDSGLESSSPTEETFATEADDDNKLATKGGVPRRRVGYLIALNISIAGYVPLVVSFYAPCASIHAMGQDCE